MKDNYTGNILIALAIGTLIFFAGAHACESYPFLARWMGGACWLQPAVENISETSPTSMSSVAQGYYLQAKTLRDVETDDEVIKAAIYALAQSGTAEAIAALKELARTHKSMEIRKAALYALAQCTASTELVAFYKAIAEKDDALELRKAAIYGLGQVGGKAAIDILVGLATSGHHVSVRKAAVHALQNCDSDLAQQALYEILDRVSGF